MTGADDVEHVEHVDRVELVDLVEPRVLWRRAVGADEPRPLAIPLPPSEPDWPTRGELVIYTGDTARERIPVRLWYLVDGERHDVSQTLQLTRRVPPGRPLSLAQALEVLANTVELPTHRRYVGDLDAAAAVMANELLAQLADPPLEPGELAPAQVTPGQRIRYAPGPFETGDEVWTVTESRPDTTRPGQGFRRVVAERIDELGQPHIRAGDHPPTARFRLVDDGVDDDGGLADGLDAPPPR